jgi:hypothetical protein
MSAPPARLTKWRTPLLAFIACVDFFPPLALPHPGAGSKPKAARGLQLAPVLPVFSHTSGITSFLSQVGIACAQFGLRLSA